MTKQTLIYNPKSNPEAQLRLICFPYAGGGIATYLPWLNHLYPNIELVIIQLPGRGARLNAPSYETMDEIASDIFNAIKTLSPIKTIFYGHSMGARVAYEVTLMLWKAQSQLPVHIIASGSQAPNIEFKKEKIHHLPDNEFIKKIGALNGTHEDILNNHELMQLLLPALRADFRIIENYCNKSTKVIPVKISVFAGSNEDLSLEVLEEWFKLFESNTGIHWISGDHFFVEKNRLGVLKTLQNVISEHIPEPCVKNEA